MTKRDRQSTALMFAVLWLPLMAGVWWLATTLTQASLGLVLAANDIPPGPIITEIPARSDTLIFAAITLVGLVLGCLFCRYGPDPYVPPPIPEWFYDPTWRL